MARDATAHACWTSATLDAANEQHLGPTPGTEIPDTLNALLMPLPFAALLFFGVGILDRKTVVLQDNPVS